jgi:hypothetical protein
MNTLCNVVKFPALSTVPSLDDTFELVRKLAITALFSALESRLGFPVEPLLDGIGRVWLNQIIRVAKALPRHFISFTR